MEANVLVTPCTASPQWGVCSLRGMLPGRVGGASRGIPHMVSLALERLLRDVNLFLRE